MPPDETWQSAQILGELVEVVLSVIREGTGASPAAGVELELWMALRRVLVREQRRLRLLEPTISALTLDDQIIDQLTDAAYQSTLELVLLGSFVEAELAIWNGFQRVARNRSVAADDPGD
jgi:hypothetical protein